MPRRAKPAKRSLTDQIKANILKVLLGLLSLGAGGGAATAYTKGNTSLERQAIAETKIDDLKEDGNEVKTHIQEHDKALNRLDRRTTRMETQQELMMDALKVPTSKRPVKEIGPEE